MAIFRDDDSNEPESCPALPTPLYSDVPVVGDMTFQEIGKIIGGACALAALLLTFVHMFLHATHLSNKAEQIKIIRITSTISVFAVVAFINIVIEHEGAIYLTPWMETYGAYTLASFFLLLCTYVSPDTDGQAKYFSAAKGGLAKHRKTWIAIFQFPVVQTGLAIATDVTEAADVLCENSNRPRFAHIWLQVLTIISMVTAVISILRFTSQLRAELKHNHIMMKLFAFKGTIFVSTIQTAIFSFVAGQVTPTDTLAYNDIVNTLPNMLICIEMILFAIFFFFAYSHRPYVLSRKGVEAATRTSTQHYEGGPMGINGFLGALNPSEVFGGIVTMIRLLTGGRAAERSYQSTAPPYQAEEFQQLNGRRGGYEAVYNQH